MKQLFRSFAISTAVILLTFLLFSGTIQTAQAQTCSTPTIDMKLLVVSNGKTEADFAAIKQILDYLGTPYDVLDMSASTGGVTSTMLSDGSCHGYYQGVIFTYGGYIYTLPGMSTLTSYEQTFGIRQLNWYMYPNNDFGFNYPYSGVITASGTDSASFTSAGASAFWYANTASPVAISNAYIYQGTPLSPLPAGASVAPLLTDASGYVLSLIYTQADGRQYLTQTFDSSPYLMHDLVLAYGLINWVTKGIFLGEYHTYAAAQVDDFFINDSEWIPGTPCTDPITHDRTPSDSTSLPFFRIKSADMTPLVAWQNKIESDLLLANFRLTLAFNGVGTTGNTDWTGLPSPGVANDDLTTNVQNYQQHFHWISHTYDHPNSLNGLRKSDPSGDPNTPQVDSIDLEILTNQYVANGTGQNLDPDPSDSVSTIHLTDFNPADLVSPGVTGLNDTSVPSYLVQDGVSYVVTDTSVIGQPNNGPNPSPNVGIVNSYAPSLYEVPRRPNDVFFNAANWSDDQAEFSCIYNNPVQPPYNTFNAAQILDYVSSSFVTNMLIGDMDPEMFHQPNLHDYDGQGHSLISDTYDQTFSKYERLFQRGVVSLTLDQLGQNMKNRHAYNLSMATASLTGTGSNQTINITVPATAAVPSAIIPVTGLYSSGAEAYGGQYISHVQLSSGQTISLAVPSERLLPSASSLTLNPSSVTGGTQSTTGTVTLSGPAPTAGAQVMLSSSNAAASVPSSVTVPAGSNSATFTVSTSPVAAPTVATIFASYDGVSPSASLTVTPLPTASSLTLNPSSVTGGAQSSVGTVMLSGSAPAGGAQVMLSSNNAAASVPSSVTVPAGSSNATFTISTTAVASSTPASISASYGGASISAVLTVLPPVPSALTLSPTSVTGATSSPTGTVTLNGPAPAGGAHVLISSSSAVARVPANGVTVPAGAITATFTLSTSAVATSTTVTVSASFGGGTQTATLTVLPPIVSSLTLNPTSVIGGPLGNSTGTVTLNGPAPAGGAQVMLASSNAAASVPTNGVTVPAGATTATFMVTTSVVVGSTSATISATYNSTTQSANLTMTL